MMKIRLENGGLHERNRRNIDLAHKKILKQILGQLGIDANDNEIKFHVNYHKCTQYKCLEGKFILVHEAIIILFHGSIKHNTSEKPLKGP